MRSPIFHNELRKVGTLIKCLRLASLPSDCLFIKMYLIKSLLSPPLSEWGLLSNFSTGCYHVRNEREDKRQFRMHRT